MKSKNLVSLLTAVSIIFGSIGNAIACTSLMVTDVNGNAYHGRTFEFSELIPNAMTYMPIHTKVVSATPAGKQGLTFDTRYAILGMSAPVVPTAKQAIFAEGLNDQGLAFSANWLNGTSATSVGNDDSKILSTNDFGAWLLGNFKTVPEVKAAMLSGKVELWAPTENLIAPKTPLPIHFAIYDKKGGALVVELLNGKTNVYDNPVGSLTNGPEFPWHLQNLNNYTFTNLDKNTGQLGKLKLSTQDAGIALAGLPAANTSQGRFVKAAFYSNYVRKAKTPDEAMITLGHIMNNFDRPYDLTIDGAGGSGDGVRGKGTSSEVTAWTVMTDLSRNLFYVRSINAMNWSVVDMNKLKDIKQVKSVSAYDIDKLGANTYDLFYK